MTKKLALLLMLVVLAGAVTFLYYYTENPPPNLNSTTEAYHGSDKYSVDESADLDTLGLTGVDISSVSAVITIKYQDVPTITAHFWGDVGLLGSSIVPKLSIETEDGIAKIEVEPRDIFSYRLKVSDLVLDVVIPISFEGSLEASSVSGPLFLEGGAKATDINLDSVSGRVSVGEVFVSGTFKAHSVSGRIETEHVSCSSYVASTVSGRIDANRVTEAKDININSISGGILLGLGDGEQFTIKASSVSGHVSCDFPMVVESSTTKKLVGRVGDGSLNVELTTVSGSINVDAL